MNKWKVRLLGLVGLAFSCLGGCGWPGLPDLDSLSIGGFGDLIQDVLFGVMFD